MKKILVAGGLLACVASLTSCGAFGVSAESESKTYEITDKVAVLSLKTGSGDADITETGGTSIKITEKLRWSREKPKTVREVGGDTLSLSYECPASLDNCGVDYTVEVPKGIRLRLEAGSGDSRLRALSGPVSAEAGSGTVEGTELSSKQVTVETGSGESRLRFASAPDSVEVKAGSGSASVFLPEGPYAVKATAGTGEVTVGITDDPAAARKVSVRAGSGDVEVKPA
ncbi:DUF4097 family beta strand repeat-containing protein [Nonomuraea longicatena]|uniref:DUF4097 domain-containing protein n=1 Tax=Nonomuraea longicatena TaxID=83682 RepID=A0ABN1NKV5_9ACTN